MPQSHAALSRSIKLFRILGFQISIDYTWFIIFALFTWVISTSYLPSQVSGLAHGTYWVFGAAAALLGMLLVGGHLALVTVPTMRVEFRLRQMRGAQFDTNDGAACRTVVSWGRTALAADPLDAAAARQVAGLALALGSNPNLSAVTRLELLEQAEELARTAEERNLRCYAVHAGLAAPDRACSRPTDSRRTRHHAQIPRLGKWKGRNCFS